MGFNFQFFEENIYMPSLKKNISLLFCSANVLFAAQPAGAIAEYNSNVRGQIEGYYVYAHADEIYFRLINQPSSHAYCKPNYFVIPATVPADRRKAMLARLSVAYALKEDVNIGYAGGNDCADSYIRVYRVG